jgi:hypothetical protein
VAILPSGRRLTSPVFPPGSETFRVTLGAGLAPPSAPGRVLAGAPVRTAEVPVPGRVEVGVFGRTAEFPVGGRVLPGAPGRVAELDPGRVKGFVVGRCGVVGRWAFVAGRAGGVAGLAGGFCGALFFGLSAHISAGSMDKAAIETHFRQLLRVVLPEFMIPS